MLFLLALLERLAPLLPQSWRAFVQRRTAQEVTPSTPARMDELQSYSEAIYATARTEEQRWQAIRFETCLRATAMLLDKSKAFHRDRERRMTRLRVTESIRLSETAPGATQPRALELSG